MRTWTERMFTRAEVADMLTRFRVARAAHMELPSDLCAQIESLLEQHAGAEIRRSIRDRHLVSASQLLEGTTWERCRTLAALSHDTRASASEEVMRELRAARAAATLPTSIRAFRDIVAKGR